MHHPPRAVAPNAGVTKLIGLLSLAALATGSLFLADAARAAFIDVPPTGEAGRLVLAADPYPAEFVDISPGEPAYWLVDARLEDATRATLRLELRKDGAVARHPRGIVMTVERCTDPWSDVVQGAPTPPRCARGEASIAVATPADDYSAASPVFDLEPLTAGAPEHLLVVLAVEDSAAARADDSLMGLTGTMGVGLTATAIDDVPIAPVVPRPGGLANTGVNGGIGGIAAFAALTAGLLGLVLVVTRLRHRAVLAGERHGDDDPYAVELHDPDRYFGPDERTL